MAITFHSNPVPIPSSDNPETQLVRARRAAKRLGFQIHQSKKLGLQPGEAAIVRDSAVFAQGPIGEIATYLVGEAAKLPRVAKTEAPATSDASNAAFA